MTSQKARTAKRKYIEAFRFQKLTEFSDSHTEQKIGANYVFYLF